MTVQAYEPAAGAPVSALPTVARTLSLMVLFGEEQQARPQAVGAGRCRSGSSRSRRWLSCPRRSSSSSLA